MEEERVPLGKKYEGAPIDPKRIAFGEIPRGEPKEGGEEYTWPGKGSAYKLIQCPWCESVNRVWDQREVCDCWQCWYCRKPFFE